MARRETGQGSAYVYNASLIADPLRTLHDSLVLSGRTETIGGRPNDTYSAFLYNTAQLYNGIDVNLNGGVNFRREETEQWTRDFIINLGANIVPHRTVIFVLNYTDRYQNNGEATDSRVAPLTEALWT